MADLFRYREVNALLSARVQDSGDSDEHPDRVLLNGYAMLTPNYRGGSIVFTEAGEYAIPRPLSVRVVDGHLMTEVLDGDDTVLQPLFLPVTAGDERQNQEWSWTLTFNSLTLGAWGEDVTHPPLSFPVPDGEGPLELSSVATSVSRTANFITRGETGRQGPTGPGITAISADGNLLHIEWEGGPEVEVEVPTVQGPQGTSVTDAVEASAGSVAFRLDDGTTTNAVPLPPGPEGPVGPEGPYGGTEVADPQVASWVNTDTETRLALDQAYIRGINANAYGAVGDGATDDTAAIQAAINAASGLGVAATIPDGRYRLTGTLDVPAGSDIRLAPGAVLDISGLPVSSPALSVAGVSGATTLLASDATERSKTIVLEGDHGLAAGDWVKVSSARNYGDTNQPIGEIQRVDEVDGNTITLADGLHADYWIADSADVMRIEFRENVTISGGHVVGDPENTTALHRGVVLDMARNVTVSGMSFQWVHYVGVWVLDSVGVSILGCGFDAALADGYGYGIMITWSVQDMSVTACHAMKVRHLVTIGGGATRRGIARRVTVTGCTASQCFDAALDAHPSAEDYSFVGNAVTGSGQDGIVAQGGRFVISGNTVTGSARHGVFVQVRTLGGLGGTIIGNTIHGTGGTGVQISFRPGAEYQVWNGLTIAGNSITDSDTHGIALSNADAAFHAEAIAITGNTLRRNARHGIHLRGARGASVGSNHVGQDGEEGIMLQNCPDSTLSGNTVSGGGLRSFRIVASPGVTVTGNRGSGAGIGLMGDAASAPVIVMGNNFAGSVTPMSLTGAGNVTSTADAAGAYNL